MLHRWQLVSFNFVMRLFFKFNIRSGFIISALLFGCHNLLVMGLDAPLMMLALTILRRRGSNRCFFVVRLLLLRGLFFVGSRLVVRLLCCRVSAFILSLLVHHQMINKE